MANPVVTFEMENGDIMKAELYPEIAPNTVNNFVSLVKKGFYDGLIFHRVISGFMIQGGCPDGTGMGGPGYSIKGEFAQNGVTNDLAHDAGVLSMARAMRRLLIKLLRTGITPPLYFPSILRLGVSGCWQRKAAWTAWRYLRMGKSMSVNSET